MDTSLTSQVAKLLADLRSVIPRCGFGLPLGLELLHRGAQQFALAGLLCEGYEADAFEIRIRLQFDLDILCERVSFGDLSNFDELLNYGNMDQVFAAILTSEDLGFDMIQRNSQVDIGIVLACVRAGFDMRM